jgi:hypothetical protein
LIGKENHHGDAEKGKGSGDRDIGKSGDRKSKLQDSPRGRGLVAKKNLKYGRKKEVEGRSRQIADIARP